MDLKKKTALVTGASKGIGFAIAEAFIDEGAQVALVGRNKDLLMKAQRKFGSKAFSIIADLSRVSEIERMYREVSDKLGKIDILVANAGIVTTDTLAEVTENEFDRVMETNVKGVYFTVQKALPYLKIESSVILLSSIAAHTGFPNFSAYSSSKGAVLEMARCFAADLAPKNIRVNSISPGVIMTKMLGDAGMTKAYLKKLEKQIPLQRLGVPKDIAEAAVFLGSDKSSYITGTDLIVDGGFCRIDNR